MQLVYILLIGIVVYYLVTRLFENYSTQEDFDPSLVPVSSIVTLAKVAQKLVDGGGTLTNPGNLTVTGDLTVNGAVNLRINNFINDITGKPRYLLNINNPSAYGANKPSYDNFYFTAPAPAPAGTVKPSQSHRFMRGDLATPADIVCGRIYFADDLNKGNSGIWSNVNADGVNWSVYGSNQNDNLFQINNANGLIYFHNTVTAEKGLTVTGECNVSGSANLNGGAKINGNLNVTGTIVCSSDVGFNGNVTTNSDRIMNCGEINTNSKKITCGDITATGSITIGSTTIKEGLGGDIFIEGKKLKSILSTINKILENIPTGIGVAFHKAVLSNALKDWNPLPIS